MKKTILAIGILILFVITAFIPMSIGFNIKLSVKSKNRDILYVGGNGPGNYSKIQDAIDNTINGDTVFVYNGTYDEYLDVHKSIKLIGEDKLITIINNSIISFLAPNIYISGFTIQYGRGIDIWNVSFSPTYSNIINDNIFKSINPIRGAVTIDNSSDNIVTNNQFFNNGLQLYNINLLHNMVYNNTINNKSLVYFEDISDKIIENAGQAIFVRCNNMTIANKSISNTNLGILLVNTDNSSIINNTISNNTIGIWLDNSNNNIISKNCYNNTLIVEILLYDDSSNITIVDNYNLSNGIIISGFNLKGWNTHTIINNSIDEGKIYYYKNNHIGEDIPSDAGQIILANCSNFMIKNMDLRSAYYSIQLAFSSDNDISNNNINNNSIGSILICSHNNNFYSNTVKDNYRGFQLYNSKENYIHSNYFKNNSRGIESNFYNIDNGINLILNNKIVSKRDLYEREVDKNGLYIESTNNIISNNTFLDNSDGIDLSRVEFDIISNNTFLNNSFCIEIYNSNNINISGNNIINSDFGIYMIYLSGSRITGNNISSSLNYAILLTSLESQNNYICGNIISNNSNGLRISGDNNIIIHNNFINNLVSIINHGDNLWDDSKYGNYWSDYKDRYPDAKPKILKPWMWDIPYEVSIYPVNKDNCPLVRQWPKSYSKDLPKGSTSTKLSLIEILNIFSL